MTDTQQQAGPVCFVDIYPYEGGSYKLQGGPLRSVQTSKSLATNVGSFQIVLAPQPPAGVLSWTQILTPMSFVVIGMQRGKNAGVVMCGFVNDVQETQTWQSGNPTQRTITVTGVDIAYYFQMLDYYTLFVIPLLGGIQQTGMTAAGLVYGDPGEIAGRWFEQIMKQNAFVNTKVAFEGTQVPFTTFMASRFDNYDVTVPFGDYFLGVDGPWFNKFHSILPYPFYEFFVTTAQDSTTYAAGTQATSPSSTSSAGYGFASTGLDRSHTGTPTVVARLNPLPQLVASVGGDQLASFDSIDTKLWNALPEFDLGGPQFFMQSTINFTDSEVFNFYTINPSWMTGQDGSSNSNLNQLLYNYGGAVDLASIVRYGYRPNQHNSSWIADITGQFANAQTANIPQLMATLYARYCGYFEATPLMGRGSVTTFLRPDIQIGCKLRYQPYNDRRDWLFYIQGVAHRWNFGGNATTTLTLDRGLPSNVYSNPALLFDIHLGNAERINGEYKSGLPPGLGAPLKALSIAEYSQWMLEIAQPFITPQATGAHPHP